MTVLKAYSIVVTDPTTDNGPAFKVTTSALAKLGQSSFTAGDVNGSPFVTMGNDNNNYGALFWGDWVASGIYSGTEPMIRFDGANNNPNIQWPDRSGATQHQSFYTQGQYGLQLFSRFGTAPWICTSNKRWYYHSMELCMCKSSL